MLAARLAIWADSRGRGPTSYLERRINFYLIARSQAVAFVGHPDNGHQLAKHRVGHALVFRGRGVGRNAVAALIRNADRDVDHFLGQRIERTRSHDLLDVLPGAFQRGRVVGQSLPEIVDPVRLAGGHDVIVYLAHFGRGVLVFDETESGHRPPQQGRTREEAEGWPNYLSVSSGVSGFSAVEELTFREWNQLMCGSGLSTRRRTAINSAVMATAISSGVIAPISSPTGA